MHIPEHIAFIMDGNRRWAKEHHLPTLQGHKKGGDRIEPLVEYAAKKGIKTLTFWAFSTENWNRPKIEVEYILHVFREFIKSPVVGRLIEKGVHLKILGELHAFPKDISERVEEILSKSAQNNRIYVNFALNYGGRQEILRAVNNLLQRGASEVDEALFSSQLYTANQKDPDLVIRTGGEQRVSGFLPWQIVYSELYFTNTYWPDFTEKEFEKALDEYTNRDRRFGK